MSISLETDQQQVLREILETTLRQLRVESARTDAREFREQLHRRERVVEGLLAQLGDQLSAAV